MKLHQLFDINNPTCLYCYKSCNMLFGSGEFSVSYPYYIDLYDCPVGHETFGVHYIIDDKVHGFEFSCNDIIVFHDYNEDLMGIRKLETNDTNFVWIVPFELSFKDKVELYNKLKIYLMFS